MLLSLFNFLIVGLFGLLMRAKLVFPIVWFDQGFLMHAHSHFAFSAWVSQTLMLLMAKEVLQLKQNDSLPSKYQSVLLLNLFTSIGMLIGFTLSGYSVISIIFSFLIVLISYGFVFFMWRDLSRTQTPPVVKSIFQGALFFNIFSSLGTYGLAVLKATHSTDPLKQLASISFYLHFQYNGWFIMACLGLLLLWLYRKDSQEMLSRTTSKILLFSIIPTYLLSILWWKEMPIWLYSILVIAVLVQLIIWAQLLYNLKNSLYVKSRLPRRGMLSFLWYFVLIAFLFKLFLQILSVVPALSTYTYSFRPIVIAYLHLVLLAIISLYLLAYSLSTFLLAGNKLTNRAILFLMIGVFLNELFLAIQGSEGLFKFHFKYANKGLFYISALLVFSMILLFIGQFLKPTALNDRLSRNKTLP